MRIIPRTVARFQLAAFTRLEAAAVAALLALLGMVALPAVSTSERRDRQAVCVNNLSRIGQAFNSWATDHQELYPFQVAVEVGGTRPGSRSVDLTDHYSVLSNYLAQTRVLVCPTDPTRTAAHRFSSLSPRFNMSYFLSHPFPWQGRSILAGDGNLPSSSTSVSCNYLGTTLAALTLPAAEGVGWDGQLHGRAGNILFNDGSVEQKDNAGLRARLTRSVDAVSVFHFASPR